MRDLDTLGESIWFKDMLLLLKSLHEYTVLYMFEGVRENILEFVLVKSSSIV